MSTPILQTLRTAKTRPLLEQAAAVLRAAKHPLIVLLKNVDADAIGSSLALAHALKQAGAEVTLFCGGPIPEALQFVLTEIPIIDNSALLDFAKYDVAVVGDAGTLKRTGVEVELGAFAASGKPLVNIDHHHAHEAFGTVPLIDEHASSTAELTYELLKHGGWNIDSTIATAVLTGIIADTDNFTNAGTTIRSLAIAADCYAHGADARRVVRQLYRNKAVNTLQLWGTMLARLTMNERWGIAATVILNDDFTRLGLTDEATEGLPNFLSTMGEIKAVLVLRELPDGQLKGSLRTVRDDIDTSKLATALGGGGHKKASGFTIPGKIVETEQGWKII